MVESPSTVSSAYLPGMPLAQRLSLSLWDASGTQNLLLPAQRAGKDLDSLAQEKRRNKMQEAKGLGEILSPLVPLTSVPAQVCQRCAICDVLPS